MQLLGRSALVVGLGKSGVAAARLLAARGARVAVADDKDEGELADSLRQLEGVPQERHLGGVREEAFRGRDLVVVSPGVPLSTPAIAGARSRGAEVIGEVELAARFVEEPIVGVTGTNGKSTTTALTAHLLRAAGKKVFAGGNLGDALSNRVLLGGKLDATVCELSSYQLEGIASLRCAAAAALNVTPDHLDRYPSLEAYAAAKERIFANQKAGDSAVLNLADPRVAAMRTPAGVRRRGFDPRGRNADAAGFVRAKGVLAVDGAEYHLRAPTLRGTHNAENALAALLLARHLGAPPPALQQGLDTYPGLPHRLEPVRTLDGVEWVNDSKGTNVDSVEKSLSAFDRGVLLIMGGRGKGAPYRPLRALFPDRVRALLTLGEDAPRIAQELGDLAPVVACGDLRTAVAEARKLARAGDTVLLSPACASYDQFRNFEDRGEQFKALVRGLS
ncbi:MAG TPA: UDP-N-acetylmuramoyl-L-alanine--D-glutamate ligase [Myxococcales bacterium]|nr:UDP-N-acetylmuramoyl-L-alanine--D-glutamate ligase [Myxococcales bacterium]